MEEKIYRVAVVGSGIAGYTAALVLNTFHDDYIWLGKGFSKKLTLSEHVRNFPSYSGDGEGLFQLLKEQGAREGIILTEERVDGIYAQGDKFFLSVGKGGYFARSVILASGMENKPALKGESEFLGRGVSYCAVCDGALYRGKSVAAVIESKEFEEDAEYLASYAETVYALCSYPDPAFRADNIQIIEDSPQEIEGKLRVEKLRLKGGELAVDGVFLLKNSAPLKHLAGGLKLQDDGVHAKVGRDLSTNLKGLFAAGDVTGKPYQYAKAAGEGLVAAYSAHAYCVETEKSAK